MRKTQKFTCSDHGCQYGNNKKSNFERQEATCGEKQTYTCQCDLTL